MNHYILIYTSTEGDHWLRDALTAEGIAHFTEIRPFYADPANKAGYGERYLTYVPPDCRDRAERIIALHEANPAEPQGFDAEIDRIPTRACPDCGRRYEVDFPKCPYCNEDIFDRIKRYIVSRFDPDGL